MALIRLQNKVPEEYVNKSRDFQLLCRLYDVLINGVKYDIDSVERLINTHECNSNALQLLQTKLGFFTPRSYTDSSIRTVLECFPFLVQRKGTRVAIEQCVYMFLKIVGIESDVRVDIINNKPTKEQKILYGSKVTDHSVVIGLESLEQDVKLLKDVLRYIIPFGYNLFFYYFTGSDIDDYYTTDDFAQIILVSNDINSAISGTKPAANGTVMDRPEKDVWNNDIFNRKETEFSDLWNDTGYWNSDNSYNKDFDWSAVDEDSSQYQDYLMNNLINAINMIETGLSESINVTVDRDSNIQSAEYKKILDLEKKISNAGE